jgi:hypothetical protein
MIAVLLMLAMVFLAAVLAPRMAEPAVVGPQDAGLALQASVTKTATFNSTGLDLGSGFAPPVGGMPMMGVVQFSAADFTTGDETYTFKLQDSPDNSTWTDRSAAVSSGVSASVSSGVLAVGGFIQQRYVRLVMTAAGTTPSITYQGYLNPFTND